MAKTNQNKKINRRVKRTIRRTLSAICMMSALIVALVPAPQVQGYTAPSGTSYVYGVSSNDLTTLNLEGVDLNKYPNPTDADVSSGNVHKIFAVTELSNGQYQLNWQFKIYMQDVNGENYGVICKYNNTYRAPLLTIEPTMPYKYCVIEEETYNDFFNAYSTAKENGLEKATISTESGIKQLSAKYSMSAPAIEIVIGDDEYYIKRFFPSQYAAHLANYNLWKTNKTAYDKYLIDSTNYINSLSNNGLVVAPTPVADPGTAPSITCYVADLDASLKGKYFCDVHPDYKDIIDSSKYSLVQVGDSRDGSETSISHIYMPQGTPNAVVEGTSYINDSLGFLVKESCYVIAIGNEAFKTTKNVEQLDLCSEIKYIGDEAFMDSFVQSVTFQNVNSIGNRAFKNCKKLASIDIKDGAVALGTEAFNQCVILEEIKFPYSVEYIGPGAFSQCSKLRSIDFTNINANCEIDDYAFFDDIAINVIKFSDNINKIGDAAFACNLAVTSSLTEFTFPANITEASALGDFILAGRTNLKKVTMPTNYGTNSDVTLPGGTFYNCINLESVVFPDNRAGSCGRVSFGTRSDGGKIFSTVQTESFNVRGPEKNAYGDVASPRKSTWGLKSGLGNAIPYVYVDSNGKEQYEISDGTYLLIIDKEGVLQSCTLASEAAKTEAADHGINMFIPETVGNTKVVGVSSTCFSDADVHNNLKTLTIADNSLSSIEAEAFKDCPKLETVHIGNSVTSIGASAFEGCSKLTYVSFETPTAGYASFPMTNIGEKAFSTGAESLIFEGDIDEAYGPFKWAMQLDNYVNAEEGIRVCYKTGIPYGLTVIVDNRNGLPTLVDYPHYDQLNELSGTADDEYPLTKRYENLGTEKDISGGIAGGGSVYTYAISLAEEKLINAALNVVVPVGIQSVDVKGYITNTSKTDVSSNSGVKTNTGNVYKYLYSSEYFPTYRVEGLFSGFYGDKTGSDGIREYPEFDLSGNKSTIEKEAVGNDHIKSITFNSVKYLPDYAFRSCEQLDQISLGASLSDIGVAPFTGCTSLTSIGGTTDDYVCYNGIVYSVNDDGSYSIVEVLSSRGLLVGSKKIQVGEEDPYLSNVKSIEPGAFENCDNITGVDLTGVTQIQEIPENCFKDCNQLNQVVLPANVTAVGHKAFADTMEGIEVVFYGMEVFLPEDSFFGIDSKRVVSYENSAVRKAAKSIGADVSEVLDNTVKVQFFDFDGKELSKIIYVKEGGSVGLESIPANPTRTGYTFAGWNKTLQNILVDTVVVATYTQNPGTTPSGNNPGGTNPGGTTPGGQSGTSGNNPTLYTLTVTNGNGSGSYAAGATVIITCTNPPTGKEFDKWVPGTTDLGIASVNVAATTMKMPAHEATVAATFKTKSTSGSSGNSVSGNSNINSSGSNNQNQGSNVIVSKPGISNTGLASATVNGSTDNYVIRITETAAATAAVEKALTNEFGSLDNIRYSAMDISLYDSTGSTKITNTNGITVTITIPIPDVLTTYAGNNKAAAVMNEKLEKLTPKFTTIDGVPCITFTATHFSPYTIYVDASNLSEGTADSTPKTGDPISPKWFLVLGLVILSMALFAIKEKRPIDAVKLA